MPAEIDRTGRIGVVPARFGPKIIGGAEIVLRKIAEGLQDRGWDVEVLTTCRRRLLQLGPTRCRPASRRRTAWPYAGSPSWRRRRARSATALGHRMLAGDRLTSSEQMRWINADVRVPELYSWLIEHATDYRALLFGPYLFWPAFACSQIAPERSLLWTCLHDEPYAYQPSSSRCCRVWVGCSCRPSPSTSSPTRILSAPAPHAVVGCGVEVPTAYDPEGFRAPARHRPAVPAVRRPPGGRQGPGTSCSPPSPGRSRDAACPSRW